MSKIAGLNMSPTGHLHPYIQYQNSLKPMYAVLRCGLVERIRLNHGIDLWLDEDGMYNQKVNMTLSVLAARLGRPGITLFGGGIFLAEDDKGDLASLPQEHIDLIKKAVKS